MEHNVHERKKIEGTGGMVVLYLFCTFHVYILSIWVEDVLSCGGRRRLMGDSVEMEAWACGVNLAG